MHVSVRFLLSAADVFGFECQESNRFPSGSINRKDLDV